MAKRGVVLLGGVAMHARALQKVAAALYPGLEARAHTHSLLQLVSVTGAHAANADAVARSLDAFPDGALLHVFSGSAFFTIKALPTWARSHRVSAVVLDSIPFCRREAKLMRVAGVPSLLCEPAGAVTRALLPLVGATTDYTDDYFRALADASTFAPASRVLVACSVDDVITPVDEARQFADTARAAWAAQPGAPALSAYEGVGAHACLARDDPNFAPAVRTWLRGSEFELA
jgi:hypothetical protein